MPQTVGKMIINRFASECHLTSMLRYGSCLADLKGPVARFLFIALDSDTNPGKCALSRMPRPNRKRTREGLIFGAGLLLIEGTIRMPRQLALDSS